MTNNRMTNNQREHAAELSSALRAVDEQALIHAVIFRHDRDIPRLRRYLAMILREHDGKPNEYSVQAVVKAQRLLADAEQVAELERMAGL